MKKNKEAFKYIKSYSPYDNVKKQNYPNMLITGGITDPRVTYWEMTKWIAKLRDFKTDENLIILDMNMDAGHSGASGRYDYLKEVALTYIFALKISNKISPWKFKLHPYLTVIGCLILGPIKSTCLTKEEKWVMLYLYLIN